MIILLKLITSFFYQILYMAIISTVVGFVVLVVRKMTNKKLSPKGHYIIWLVFVLSLVCPIALPSKISIYNYIDVASVKQNEKEYSNDMLEVASEMQDDANRKESILTARVETMNNDKRLFTNYFKFIIPVLGSMICLINLSKVIYSYFMLNQLIGKDEIEDKRIIEILERCKTKLKIKKNIKLIKQDYVKTPSVVGIYHVRILLTETAYSLDDLFLADIFMHELSHYKKRDHIVKMIMLIAEAIYWFNPFLPRFLEELKNDMELATDEMAVESMDEDEKFEYCKVVIKTAGLASSKVGEVLGLADDLGVLENRVEMVLKQEKFKKNARRIMAATISIVLCIWMIFYPSSYGMFAIPKVYLELEDGTKIETTRLEEENQEKVETVQISQNENLKLLTEGGRCEDYVAFTKTNLDTMKNNIEVINLESKERICCEVGEFIYKFTVKYGNHKSCEYGVRIIVE